MGVLKVLIIIGFGLIAVITFAIAIVALLIGLDLLIECFRRGYTITRLRTLKEERKTKKILNE